MKDMTSVATTMMTDEEKAEMEKQMNSGRPNGSSGVPDTKSETQPAATATTSPSLPGQNIPVPSMTYEDSTTPTMSTTAASSPISASTSQIVPHGSTLPPASGATGVASASDKEREKREAARRKAEQREKLREHERARRKAMEERVAALTTKMIERLRLFVEAKDPGGKDDPESTAFAEKMKREVEDLKLESFGVEVYLFSLKLVDYRLIEHYLIAAAYDWQCIHDESILFHEVTEIFGNVRRSLLFILHLIHPWLCSPGFFSRIKEKGTLAKDVWGVIGSA